MKRSRMRRSLLVALVTLATTACGSDDPPLAADVTRTSSWKRQGDSLVLVSAMEVTAATMRSVRENPPKPVTLSNAAEVRLRALIARDTLARRLDAALMSSDTATSPMRLMPPGAKAMPYDSVRGRAGWSFASPVERDTQLITSVMAENGKPPVVMSTFQVRSGTQERIALTVARNVSAARPSMIVVMEVGEKSLLGRPHRATTSQPAPTP